MLVVIQRNPHRLQEWLCRSLCWKGLTAHTFITFIASSYEYLWFILDESLLFKLHTQRLVEEPEVELGVHFGDEACIFLIPRQKKKQIISKTNCFVADCRWLSKQTDWASSRPLPPAGIHLGQIFRCNFCDFTSLLQKLYLLWQLRHSH